VQQRNTRTTTPPPGDDFDFGQQNTHTVITFALNTRNLPLL
jgi:hypothetical protein